MNSETVANLWRVFCIWETDIIIIIILARTLTTMTMMMFVVEMIIIENVCGRLELSFSKCQLIYTHSARNPSHNNKDEVRRHLIKDKEQDVAVCRVCVFPLHSR